MVQALINNTNNINLQTKPTAQNSMMSENPTTTDFQKMYDKQTSLNQHKNENSENSVSEKNEIEKTLGDVKNKLTNELNNEWSNFQNLLKEVTTEIADENSLDLTLSKDVAEESSIGIAEEDSATGVGNLEEWLKPVEESEEPTLDEELPTQDSEMVIGDAVQTAIQLTIQNQDKTSTETDISENIEINDEELTVTINGKGLEETLNDLTNNATTDEIVQVNTPKTESEISEAKTLEDIVDEEMLKDLKLESIEAEVSSDSESGADLMQNQSAQEQGIKAMIQTEGEFSVNQTSEVKSANTVNSTKQTLLDSNPARILEQVSKQMEGLANSSKVNIVLNPESLGKVSVQLINTKEGLSAQFTVATQDAKNILMKGLEGLKDTLLSQGVSVDNVTVKMSETPDGKNNSDWTDREGSRGGNKEQNPKERGNKQEFEKMLAFTDFENENGNV